MSLISGSVGERGENAPNDVEVVQRLLNKHRQPPMAFLSVDGVAGRNTIEAIKNFQASSVGLQHPDGRVDPGGKTIRFLNRGPNPDRNKNEDQPERTAKSTSNSKKSDIDKRRKFVNPEVKENEKTTKIIDSILPHFDGVEAKVISGYLNDADLFWKVNYHWEYLKWMVEHAMTLDTDEKHKTNLQSILSTLISNKPEPESGYRTSGKVGVPTDKSSREKFDERYKIVKQTKRDFKKIIQVAELKKKSKRSAKSFDYAVAPVAHPGNSRHGTGYALDISGNNAQIKSICKKLGATVTFDERSHVHVEFGKGVPK